MNEAFNFFKTTMPGSRKADYYLGCLESCVYIDFNRTNNNLISLCRISFDGYGCCNLNDASIPLNREMSEKFIEAFGKDEFDQDELTSLVKEAIRINQAYIWEDPLKEYGFIEPK